jgi:hypothetical protein
MKKLLFLLFFIPLVYSFSFGDNKYNHSLNINLTIQDPDFRGVWEVFDEEGVHQGFQVIWMDEKNRYQTLYMDYEKDITNTTSIYLKNSKLWVESFFAENNWRVVEVFTMVDKDKIEIEGTNQQGNFILYLHRLKTQIDRLKTQYE